MPSNQVVIGTKLVSWPCRITSCTHLLSSALACPGKPTLSHPIIIWVYIPIECLKMSANTTAPKKNRARYRSHNYSIFNVWNNPKQRAKNSRGPHGEGPRSHRLVLLLDQKLAFPCSISAAHYAANPLQPYQESLDRTSFNASVEQCQKHFFHFQW